MLKSHIGMAKECRHLNVTKDRYIDPTLRWSNNRIGNIYGGIINRCYNSNDKAYRWYGGKGIKVCQEWLNNPILFEEWSLQNGYEDDLTIDRKDSSKDYAPDNCRWITLENNVKYKSTTKILDVDGIKHTGRDWSKILGFGINTINTMLRKYSEDQVKELIRRRIKDPNKYRQSHKTWMRIYGLE